MSVILPILESLRATFGRATFGRATLGQADRLSRQSAPRRLEAGIPSVDNQSARNKPVRTGDARFWLAAIGDSSDSAIVGKDLSGLITSWNKAAETMFGYAMEEIVGQPMIRIIPADRIDEEVSLLERVRRSGKMLYLETKRQCKDGRVIPVSLGVALIRDDAGRIIGVSNAVRDLPEMQRAHRDLERREALLRSILDTVPDALIVIDKQGFIHSFSVGAVRLFGYTAAEMMGQNVSVLLPASDWDQHNSALSGYAATGERHISGFGQRKDRGTFPMELAIGEVNLQGTRLFTTFVHDLTGQAEREREMRAANIELERLARDLTTARDLADRSNWAKSRFLSDMGHELRTPLDAVLANAAAFRADGGLNDTQSGQVDAMLDAGKHLLQLIGCVLELSEVEAEHVELQAVELDVLVAATACLDRVRPAAEAKGLTLRIAVAPGIRQKLVTDPLRLQQVLSNLLGNAVKLTNQGTVELRLRSMADGSVLRIAVADTSPGIPVEERRRLFRDFGRLDAEATNAAEGSGLGLALSARLATLMGGCVGHHDNPGGGSVFWLELPLETTNASTVAALPAEHISVTPVVPLHVLVVDDVAMNRDIAGSFLRSAGHRVTCVEGGAEAIAAVATVDFDVVLMDVRMPEMDGLEATRRIRALGNERGRVPIVALTAQAFPEQVTECRKAGMDSHLPKPFDPDTLLAAALRATVATPEPDESLGPTPASASVSVPLALPIIGSELLVFNPTSFERTAFYLAPEAVSSYLEAIAERGKSLLSGLRGPDAIVQAGDELAEAAHTIAGSAGMFGFERLTVVGRRFERAVQAGAAEVPALADGLSAALEVTLQAIHDRTLISVNA